MLNCLSCAPCHTSESSWAYGGWVRKRTARSGVRFQTGFVPEVVTCTALRNGCSLMSKSRTVWL